MLIKRHAIPSPLKPIRLGLYLRGIFDELPTSSSIKKAFQKDLIRINGVLKKSGYWVQPNDIITLSIPPITPNKTLLIEIPVIYEDDYLAIVHKPAGIRTSGNQFYTLENALSNNLTISAQADATRPKPVHRLDLQTAGLLIVAKTQKTRILLGQLFEKKLINKEYHALVIGKISAKGYINYPINEKQSYTEFERIRYLPSLKNRFLSLVKLAPKTGRTHQIRIHLSTLGFPILGDKLYGHEGMILKKKGLFLCATRLVFPHPILDTTLDFSIDIPYKFINRLKKENIRYLSINKLP